MLWSHSKKIRTDLDSIALRIGLIERAIETNRDNTRQMHADISDKQRLANEKLDEIKEALAKLVPTKKPRAAKKTKPTSTSA
jgi:hypothetical protein